MKAEMKEEFRSRVYTNRPAYAKQISVSSHLSKPKAKYYISPIVMPDYCKLIIKKLAVHYSGDMLIEKAD